MPYEIADLRKFCGFPNRRCIQRHPYLAIFDGADPSASSPKRTSSTTPLQALYLLNDTFVREQARRGAERITAHADDDAGRIRLTYELLFARPAAADEIASAQGFLEKARAQLSGDDKVTEAWRGYLRVLFRLNEFVYVD